MRTLRFTRHKDKPLSLGFSTWVHEPLKRELIGWANDNLTEGTVCHPRAHTWHFASEAEMERFIAHRPMSDRKILTPQYFVSPVKGGSANPFPFEVAAWVTVLSTTHGHLDDDVENRMDWFWVHVDDWIVEHCRSRVGWTHVRPDLADIGALRHMRSFNHYTQHYGFESAEEAVLFRIRWN